MSEFIWRNGDKDYSVRLEEANGTGTLHFADSAVAFIVHDRQPVEGWIEVNGRNHRYFVHRHRNELTVWIDGHTYRFERLEADRPGTHAGAAGSASGEVRALMPGKVLRIEVAEGATVTEKQTVIVMESMKMESSLHAPRAGKVAAIRCEVGKVVDMGDVLMVIE